MPRIVARSKSVRIFGRRYRIVRVVGRLYLQSVEVNAIVDHRERTFTYAVPA